MSSEPSPSTVSHRSGGLEPELGAESVCCLLHNLLAGGSTRQWVNLLARHVDAGGRATILAPAGPLSATARAAGVETVDMDWASTSFEDPGGPLGTALAGHDAAIVHWDDTVMNALEPALSACGRVGLVLHQPPDGLARWWGPEVIPPARAVVERAVAAPNAVVLARGEWHRERFVKAFALPRKGIRILPASIPLPAAPGRAASAQPGEVLALTRLSAEKEAIVRLAAELTRFRIEDGHPCRLALAGEGHWREGAVAICEEIVPDGAWHLEAAPPDPLARLAAADVVVAQGLTTLEAAALERRVLVARTVPEGRSAGIALRPESYDSAAVDPFAQPEVTTDYQRLWREALALDAGELATVRATVAQRNSLDTAARALGDALRSIGDDRPAT